MSSLTIGEIAGLINVGILFLKLFIPLLQTIALLGGISLENSAVTWTVISRIVDSTPLPSLLKTDSSSGRRDGVALAVAAMTYISMAATVILALAQVLAPVGLAERVASMGLTNVTFAYAPDPSVFQQATFARDRYLASRACNNRSCPGVPADSGIRIGDEIFFDPAIPENITGCFSSGTASPEDWRADSFDIEFRQYAADEPIIGKKYLQFNVTGTYQYIGWVTAEQGYHVRDGIVVDAVDGGIGFRNHTVPTTTESVDYITWSEDLLWITPATSCIQTNWTIYSQVQLAPFAQYQVSSQNYAFVIYENHAALYGEIPVDGQGPCRFGQRLGDAAAELTKSLTTSFNLTKDSTTWNISMTFDSGQTSDISSLQTFGDSLVFAIYRPLEYWDSTSNESLSLIKKRSARLHARQTLTDTECWGQCIDEFQPKIDDCFTSRCGANIKATKQTNDLLAAVQPCKNHTRITMPSIEYPFIACYFMVPPPRAVLDTGIPWNGKTSAQPISLCATGLKATIKSVEFKYSSPEKHPTLERLSVLNVQPKAYEKDIDKPMWAVVKVSSNWTVEDIALQWGIVSKTAKTNLGKTLTQYKAIACPYPYFSHQARMDMDGVTVWQAGNRAYGQSLDAVFQDGKLSTPNYETFIRWANWSKNGTAMNKIIDLEWTDIFASTVTGTKSRLGKVIPGGRSREFLPSPQSTGEVLVYRKKIVFEYAYATPAFVYYFIWVVWALTCLYMLMAPRYREKISVASLVSMINKLSVGRLLSSQSTAHIGKDADNSNDTSGLKTKDWVKKDGQKSVDLSSWPLKQRPLGETRLRSSRKGVSETGSDGPDGDQETRAGKPLWQQ